MKRYCRKVFEQLNPGYKKTRNKKSMEYLDDIQSLLSHVPELARAGEKQGLSKIDVVLFTGALINQTWIKSRISGPIFRLSK